MRLQSAIFDMDGTLLDSMHIWDHLCCKILREWGYDADEELNNQVLTMTMRDGAEYCRKRFNIPKTTDELIEAMHDRVSDFYHNQVQAKPGVEKFLSLLKMEGVWMYVATNTERSLAEAALKHAGIDQYFRGMLTCAEVGQGKKDGPEIYERAMRRLQSNKRDTVIFEDALHAVRTAKAAGFRVAAIYDLSAEADQDAIRAEADYYFRSFEELFDSQTI